MNTLREQVEAERLPHLRWHDEYSHGWNDAIDAVLAIIDAHDGRIERLERINEAALDFADAIVEWRSGQDRDEFPLAEHKRLRAILAEPDR